MSQVLHIHMEETHIKSASRKVNYRMSLVLCDLYSLTVGIAIVNHEEI